MTPIDIELFAGAGGAAQGALRALGKSPDIAINHSPSALAMYKANHPPSKVLPASVWDADPAQLVAGRQVRLLWLSPDCRHHSKAKGSAPVSQSVRSLADVSLPWLQAARPQVFALENVPEFLEWGPLVDGKPDKARSGDDFRRWVSQQENEGYALDWRTLDAADYGVPQHRLRLWLVGRRDGDPIRWPEPTHGPGRTHPWRPASEVIDWSLPMLSIFATPSQARAWARQHGRRTPRRPLAAATQRRLAAGLVRFVLQDPQPFVSKFYGTSIGHSLQVPLSTISSQGNHHALILPWLAKHYTGAVGSSVREPLSTITAVDHHSLCGALDGEGDPERVVAWVTKWYGNSGPGASPRAPLPTVTAREGLGLAVAVIRERRIVDVLMRMLAPRELLLGQSFPADYQLIGTQRQKVAAIGNAAPPAMVEAILRANFPLRAAA